MSFEEIKPAEHVMASVSSTINLGRPVSDYTGPRRFSYSASNLLLTCERKYWLKYVANMPDDPDVTEDAHALVFGKVYHHALETCFHERSRYNPEALLAVCKETNLEMSDFYKISACVESYFRLREKSGLKAIGIEFEVGDEHLLGFIDAVVADVNGNFWIMDLKTSGAIMDNLFPRLSSDPQLNLYAAYKDKLAAKLGIDVRKFAGVIYNVVQKKRMEPKAGEALAAYIGRALPDCYDIEIPKDRLDPQAAVDAMMRLKAKSDILREVTDKTKTECNRGKCLDYNRSCQFWSHCYSGTFTECQEAVRIFTPTTSVDRTLPDIVTDSLDLLF